MNRLTNAEALIQGLKNIEDYDCALSIASYINCPYTSNPDCKYDGDDDCCCDDCKIDWLNKKFEG